MKRLYEFKDDGNLPSIVEKIANVIGRKVGYELSISPFPLEYKGMYAFICGINKGNLGFISLNFDGGNFYSVSLIDDLNDLHSEADIVLEGYNIVQVVDEVSEIIKAYIMGKDVLSMELEESYFRERKPVAKGTFFNWLNDYRGADRLLTDERLSIVYKNHFLDWANANKVLLSVTAFNQQAKEYLAKNKLENKYARKVLVMKGDDLSYVDPPSKEEIKWEEAKAETYETAFAQIDMTVPVIAKQQFNLMYCFGTPGSGKSTRIEQALDNTTARYIVIKGGIKDTDSLVQTLYHLGGAEPIFDEENDEKIINVIPNPDSYDVIVFDDADNIIKNKNNREILLAATDDKRIRVISWKSPKLQNLPKKKAVPSRFIFNSSIIVISNSEKVDSALADRALPVPVVFSKKDMLEAIIVNLDNFMPGIPMEAKTEVLEWFIEKFDSLSRISFRGFKKVMLQYFACGGDSKWKIFAERSINAY